MHCYQRPTVALALQVPRDLGGGDWEWSPCPVIKPIEEIVYTEQDLCQVLRTYGALVAEQAHAADPQPFTRMRFVVTGLFSGRTMGVHEWIKDPTTGRWQPDGAPMITFPPMHTWPDEVIRGWAYVSGKTGGKPCGTCPYK